MTDTAASCREEAHFVRAQATKTSSLVVKQHLEEIAGSYDVLARFLELVDQPDASVSASAAGSVSAAAVPSPPMRRQTLPGSRFWGKGLPGEAGR